MPDYTLKPSFPIASVIDAAQRKAQIEQQAKETGNAQLLQGLGAIGQIGKSYFDQKRQIAQSLALGRQLGISDDESRSMTPDQIVSVAKVKQGNVDMQALFGLLNPGKTFPGATVPSTPLKAGNPGKPEVSTSPLPSTANKATAALATRVGLANRPKPVMSKEEALAAGEVPSGTQILDMGREERHDEAKFTNVIKAFDNDPGARKQVAAIDSANTVRELVISGNPIAAGAIPTYMARASGEVGNLSEADKAPFGGTRAILGRMDAAFQQMATGQLSQSNREFLLEMADMMEQNANKNLDRRARELSRQYSKPYKMKDRDLYDTLRPGRSFEEEPKKSNSSGVLSADKAKRLAALRAKRDAGTLGQ